LDDQVLLKSDGFPTYHLAATVDDHLMQISHVVRGEEWLPSFPKHVLLYRYFGWDMPLFYHTSALRNPDKSKLSKRQGHTNISWYQEEGYLPSAILNFLALLGWSHPEEKEIFSLDEFIQNFDLKDIKPIGPIFDLTKLTWMNGVYIREVLTSPQLLDALYTFDSSLREIEFPLFEKLVEIAKTRIKTLKEFKEMITPFLKPQAIKKTSEEKDILTQIGSELDQISTWTKDAIAEVILQKFILNKRITFKQLYTLLINTDKGLPLADTFAAIGKEQTIKLFINNE
jgi:glutamyl-tRNA synthetase